MDGFKNRIVGEGCVDPKTLATNPANWRTHPKSQQQTVTGILEEVGWVKQILVNKRTGLVVDGHLRLKLAIERREKKVPVLYVDLDEQEEKLVLVTIDPSSELAVPDKNQLDAIMEQLEVKDAALLEFLDDLKIDEEFSSDETETGGTGSNGERNLGTPRFQIKPVLYADQVLVLEEALAATGQMNRGEALMDICRFYVANQKRQLDAKEKGRTQNKVSKRTGR